VLRVWLAGTGGVYAWRHAGTVTPITKTILAKWGEC
jgi:hypothetical protein